MISYSGLTQMLSTLYVLTCSLLPPSSEAIHKVKQMHCSVKVTSVERDKTRPKLLCLSYSLLPGTGSFCSQPAAALAGPQRQAPELLPEKISGFVGALSTGSLWKVCRGEGNLPNSDPFGLGLAGVVKTSDFHSVLSLSSCSQTQLSIQGLAALSLTWVQFHGKRPALHIFQWVSGLLWAFLLPCPLFVIFSLAPSVSWSHLKAAIESSVTGGDFWLLLELGTFPEWQQHFTLQKEERHRKLVKACIID